MWREKSSSDPSADRRRLLRTAALAPPDHAVEAWRAWCANADAWRFDPASQWWLPLVWWNLRFVLPDSRERTDLRHEYTQAWIRSQHLLARVAPALEALHREGIETLILKGAALALGTYERPGLRPFGDVDVLVQPERAQAARQVLEQAGWAPFRRVASEMLPIIHGLGYTDSDGVNLDLHWYALAECCVPGIDQGFWNRAVPLAVDAAKTRALSPGDQLLHVCVHGQRFAPIPTAHWIADAAMILRRADHAVVWETFVNEARARHLTFQVRRALSTLDDDIDDVPSQAVAGLDATHARWWEPVEYHAKRTVTGPSVAVQSWCTEARSRALGAGGSTGFTARLQAAAHADDRRQLARRITMAALGRGRRVTRTFEAYGRHVQVDAEPGVDMRHVVRALDARLPRFPIARRRAVSDRRYQLWRIDRPAGESPDYRALVNGDSLAAASTVDDIIDVVVADLQVFLARSATGRTFLHAGVVNFHGRVIVLPGESGSGKSTLVAAMLRAGATYSSDEFAILDMDGRVHPYPRPLKLRHPGGADEHVRPDQWGAQTAIEPLRAGLVLFAPFRADGAFAPRPLSSSAALLRLLNHCPAAQGRPAETMAGLRVLVQTAPTWATERSDTDCVIQALASGAIGRA